jgi:hypothetical protein
MRQRQFFENLGERQKQQIKHRNNRRHRAPDFAASSSTLAPNKVLPTMLSVRRIISRSMSRISPSRHSLAIFAVFDHRLRIFVDSRAMKSRLNHSPLAQMKFLSRSSKALRPKDFWRAAARDL